MLEETQSYKVVLCWMKIKAAIMAIFYNDNVLNRNPKKNQLSLSLNI